MNKASNYEIQTSNTEMNKQSSTPASEIVDYVELLAKSSELLSRRAKDKLAPIMFTDKCIEKCDSKEALSGYPPLFEILRVRLSAIEISLEDISRTLDRIEL